MVLLQNLLFLYSMSWFLKDRTSGIQLKTCPWQQKEQVNGCGYREMMSPGMLLAKLGLVSFFFLLFFCS